VTPCLECFITFDVGNYGKVGNNNACNIYGIGTIRLSLNNGQELLLGDIMYAPGIKNSLLTVGQET
jgi:hypothetical protein